MKHSSNCPKFAFQLWFLFFISHGCCFCCTPVTNGSCRSHTNSRIRVKVILHGWILLMAPFKCQQTRTQMIGYWAILTSWAIIGSTTIETIGWVWSSSSRPIILYFQPPNVLHSYQIHLHLHGSILFFVTFDTHDNKNIKKLCLQIRVGYIDYSITLDLASYLRNEKEYVPWEAFFKSVKYIEYMLSKSQCYGQFQVFCNWNNLASKSSPHPSFLLIRFDNIQLFNGLLIYRRMLSNKLKIFTTNWVGTIQDLFCKGILTFQTKRIFVWDISIILNKKHNWCMYC